MQRSIVHIIAGPTASGKSARALALALESGGVIINADSMQLYNGLPLLTAQPSLADFEKVPHRLYGVLDVHGQTNAVSWRKMALDEIYSVLSHGLVPVVVGGTGFYLKALMEGLSPIPEIPPEERILAEDLLEKVGLAEFFEIIKEHDAELAEKIDPQNRQRLVRAFEVIHYTGKKMSYWQSLPSEGVPEDLEFKVELMSPAREDLYARCNARFDQMVAQGVIDEVAEFDEKIEAGKIPPECPLTHALGFEPLQSYLRGEMDRDTAIVLAKNETRHYAKRQVTWFKSQMLCGN